MRGGHYVIMARRRAGLTQRQLAELLGLRQATIARWEPGDRGVSVDDASDARAARRDSLALQAVVDVQREHEAAGTSDEPAAGDRIAEWLRQQTPFA